MNEDFKYLKRNLVIASSNMGKINEFKNFFSSLPLNLISQADGLDINETGQTFAQNASLKALAVASFSGELSLADDSGLSIKSLGGAPGIYSSRYASNDQKRIQRVLKELASFENRDAIFCSALCIASPQGEILLEVEGRCEGLITHEPRGVNGFGYDPIFEVKSIGLTFAEMNKEQKQSLGHRGKAFKALIPGLKKLFDL